VFDALHMQRWRAPVHATIHHISLFGVMQFLQAEVLPFSTEVRVAGLAKRARISLVSRTR